MKTITKARRRKPTHRDSVRQQQLRRGRVRHAAGSTCIVCGENTLVLLRFEQRHGLVVCIGHDPDMSRSMPLATHLAKETNG
jgi:hypothetical protein